MGAYRETEGVSEAPGVGLANSVEDDDDEIPNPMLTYESNQQRAVTQEQI